MIEEAVGKVIGMAMAYLVSSLGLLLAYYNYRKRIVKAERVFTPAAIMVIVLVVVVTVGGAAWILAMKPIKNHGCVCVEVVNRDGRPLEGAMVWAENVSDGFSYERQRTDEEGRACVTVMNSADAPNQVNVFAAIRKDQAAYPENPVTAPEAVASCLLNKDCPEKCKVLAARLPMSFEGEKWDPAAIHEEEAAEMKRKTHSLGIALPIVIFAFSFFITFALYRHFTRRFEEGGEP